MCKPKDLCPHLLDEKAQCGQGVDVNSQQTTTESSQEEESASTSAQEEE